MKASDLIQQLNYFKIWESYHRIATYTRLKAGYN